MEVGIIELKGHFLEAVFWVPPGGRVSLVKVGNPDSRTAGHWSGTFDMGQG
jgi:hypothetical protein